MASTQENVQLVRAFLEFKAREGKSRRTIHSYGLKLGSLLEFIDPQPIGALRVEDLERWIDRDRAKRCPSGRAALGTVRSESAILRSAFKFWSARDLVPSNAAALLGNVDRPRRQPKPADQALTRMLLEVDIPLDERFTLEAMHHLGLRREEVCRLRPSAFDVDAGIVTIEGKGSKERVIEFRDLVTWQRAKGYAVGDFNGTVLALLAERSGRATTDTHGVPVEAYMLGWGERSRAVFAPMADPQMLNKRLDARLVSLGLRRGAITPHQFRHAFGTYMLRLGMDLLLVSTLMGHSSLSVTQDYLDLGGAPVRELLRRELQGLVVA